jgi:hypothetical protein
LFNCPQFYPDPALQGLPTEIYIPPIHYPGKKFDVSASSNLEWSVSEENENILLIYCNNFSADQISFISISASN